MLRRSGWNWNPTALRRTSLRSAALRRSGALGEGSLARSDPCCRLCGMSMDSELQKHYALLLGVGSPWEVKTVDLNLEGKKVEIELGWQWGAAAKCPECGRECSIHDCAPERTWRHLDTMQFTTLIRARTPRSDCPEHGVKIITPPRPGSMEKKGLEDAGWRVRSARVVWNLARIAARTYACR